MSTKALKWEFVRTRCLKKGLAETFDPARERIVFTHVPKTAGTSLHKLLEDTLPSYALIDPSNRNLVDLEALSGAGGHHNFGLNPLCALTDKKLVHLTILRDPYARYLSFYKHLQNYPRHHLPAAYPEILEMGPVECAMLLIKVKNPEISNLHCKMLRGDSKTRPTALNAFNNLSEFFSVYSTFENIDLFVSRLGRLLGRPITSFPKLRVGDNSISLSSDDTRELKKLIYDVNSEDVRLYELVRQHDISAYHAW